MEIPKIDREGIIEQILTQRCVGEVITYSELQQLHRDFEDIMSEEFFATYILGISKDNYR